MSNHSGIYRIGFDGVDCEERFFESQPAAIAWFTAWAKRAETEGDCDGGFLELIGPDGEQVKTRSM